MPKKQAGRKENGKIRRQVVTGSVDLLQFPPFNCP